MTRANRSVAPALLVALALVAGACLPSSIDPTPGATTSNVPTTAPSTEATPPVDPVPTPPVAVSSSPEATAEPTGAVTPPPAATDPPATADPGATAAPGETAAPGAADACTGNDQNREFYLQVAAAVAWPVYCAVLPAGWFVQQGSYRLANGGKLEITYAGPGGARLALSEGAFCPDTSGCVPAGSDAGVASFGDKPGTLVSLSDGGWAIVVDRGAPLSWLLVGGGLDEAQVRALGNALTLVES